MDLGNAIKSLRKSLKVSRKRLATNSGISITALYNIENNMSFPSKITIDKICSTLGVPMSFLLFFSITEEDVPEEEPFVGVTYIEDSVKIQLQLLNSDSGDIILVLEKLGEE